MLTHIMADNKRKNQESVPGRTIDRLQKSVPARNTDRLQASSDVKSTSAKTKKSSQ
jgi:hypothetical protein